MPHSSSDPRVQGEASAEHFLGSIIGMLSTKKNANNIEGYRPKSEYPSFASVPSEVSAINNLMGLIMDLFFVFRKEYMYLINM